MNFTLDIQKQASGVNISAIKDVLLIDSISWDLRDSYLSPWKILQCYLESTLQVGIILEMIGDGVEAEKNLRLGKAISCSLQLPIFLVTFSSFLGKLYVKKRQSVIAEKELQSAEKILKDGCTTCCCSKCKLLLEVNLYQYHGDLWQHKLETCTEVISEAAAKKWYTLALEKLNLSEWKNPLTCPVEGNDEPAQDMKCGGKTCACLTINEAGGNVKESMKAGPETKTVKVLQSALNKEGCTVASKYSSNCVSKTRCWHCLPSEVMNSGLLNDFNKLKWEFVRRQISMNLLTRLVKCFSMRSHETCTILRRSISVLVSRNPFNQDPPSVSLDYFHHLIATEVEGDVFALQRAEIVHDICLYSLRSYNSNDKGNILCKLSSVKFEDLASWLMIAFVLSRDDPLIFQKVSKLLAVMYVISASSEQFSLSSFSKVLGDNCWASYFHQASIGTHFTYQFLSHLSGRYKGSCVTGSSCTGEGRLNLLRPVPETSVDLAEYAKKFLAGLPSTAIINITLLGHDYIGLLEELLSPTCVQAWMLVSRLSFKSEPIIMLLPLDSILQASDEDDISIGSGTFSGCEISSNNWHCRWGFTVVDVVAPAFKTILEASSCSLFFEDTEQTDELQWKLQTNLDRSLDKFLRNLEDSWFGSWKWLLLGKFLNCKNFDSVLKNLVNGLRSECKLDVNEDLVRVILGGSTYMREEKLQLSLKKDCFIAQVGYCEEVCNVIFSNSGIGLSYGVALNLIHEAVNVLKVDDSVNREPIILVLDYEVQMLPWESLPILRNQEVYRMPSVSSICAVLDNKASNHQEQVERNSVRFPAIDPLDAFYVLNPSGDLYDTQEYFESWFKQLNLKGKAGSGPTIPELSLALKSHDLYIYIGHECGSLYIPTYEIRKLDKCAVSLLMGCSSGILTSDGSYTPKCVPLSYLMGGSPAIIATLWGVLGFDISRFLKDLLRHWFKERRDLPTECLQCKLLHVCCHRRKIGAFMGNARRHCVLPLLTGASIVCYGVPTGIWRKIND